MPVPLKPGNLPGSSGSKGAKADKLAPGGSTIIKKPSLSIPISKGKAAPFPSTAPMPASEKAAAKAAPQQVPTPVSPDVPAVPPVEQPPAAEPPAPTPVDDLPPLPPPDKPPHPDTPGPSPVPSIVDDDDSNTLIWVGLGVVVLGGAVWLATRK